jgi:nucleoside-diphosphate-sugar epimerase
MSTLRVAVTGGSGHIGHHLIKHLLDHGHQVVNLDRRQARQPLCRFVFIDLRQRDQVQRALEHVDAVCHLGEIPNVDLPISPEEIFHSNTAAGSTVLQCAADLGLRRAIYTSSCQAYGCWGRDYHAPLHLPFDETLPLRPQNAYGLSKAVNEDYAHLVARRHGLSVAIFRFPWVNDWDMKAKGPDWKWFADHTGRGEGFATYVHVSDAVAAYRLALEHPRPGCEAYHFIANEVMCARPIRAALLEHHPDFPPLPVDWPLFKSPVLTDKAREHFGWQPAWNLLDFYRQAFGRDPHAA